MVGSGKAIPDRDANEIGIPARIYLENNADSFVLLIDDLEFDRRNLEGAIFERYRNALDMIVREQKDRCSVHFLVYMLEAYFFAHADIINSVLEPDPPFTDRDGDVETIRHPKGDIKDRCPHYREREHGRQMLESLDLVHVLSKPDTCAGLRTLMAWCLAALSDCPAWAEPKRQELMRAFRIPDGRLREPACKQAPLHSENQARYAQLISGTMPSIEVSSSMTRERSL
jgi:hypothetical protein